LLVELFDLYDDARTCKHHTAMEFTSSQCIVLIHLHHLTHMLISCLSICSFTT